MLLAWEMRKVINGARPEWLQPTTKARESERSNLMVMMVQTGMETDNELMTRVHDGEVEQLGVLFERYHKLLLHFFLRFTNDHATSEDLVQEVFLRMLKYKHTFGPGSQFSAWMYQIARNIQIKHYRKRSREVFLDEDEYRENVPDHELRPDEQMERDQAIGLLKAALAKLPEDKREVLVLSRMHDMKYREIAERLHCDEGTVKVRAFRALKDVEKVYRRLASDPVVSLRS